MQNQVIVTVEGISSLLMHRFPMEPVDGYEKMTAERQAEIAAYRETETNELYIPGVALWKSLIDGATYVKGKGRASQQKSAAACLQIDPEHIGLGTTTYLIDSRRIVNPMTKGAMIRHRPRINEWRATFTLSYDPTMLSMANVRDIVDCAGSRVGVLDFRPARKGPFGRFRVIHWQEL